MSGLPAGWVTTPLGEVADVQLGKMLDRKRTEGTSLPYLRNANVRWGRIDVSDLLEMPFRDHELTRYAVHPGDVLICEGGEPGRAAVWTQQDQGIKYQKALHRVRLAGGLLPNWLVYQLHLDATNGRLSKQFTGTTIGHLPREAIVEYQLRLAPVPEQRRIVEAIESYFTRLDDAVATLERVQRNLKRYRASVLKAAVEGRLVPTEAELARAEGRDYEPASVLLERILAERRRRWQEVGGRGMYQEPVAPDTRGLPDLPQGWCWARAEQVCEFITKGTTPKSHLMTQGSGEVPYIKVYNLTFDGSLDFSIDPTFVGRETHRGFLARSAVLPGDVLVNIVGPPLGKVSVVPSTYPEWNINQAIARFRPGSGLENRYMALLLGSPFFLAWAKSRSKATAGQFNLTLAICRDAPVPVPPPAEQVRIVNETERALSLAVEADQTTGRDLVFSARLRQSILKWAFEGKVADQDPNDEPATALLERIQSQTLASRLSAGDTGDTRRRRSGRRRSARAESNR